MIYEWVRQLVENYTFIEKATFKEGYILLYYKKDDIETYMKISRRATPKQLLHLIDKIKLDINYDEIKKERDEKLKEELKKEREKPLMFVNNEVKTNE